MKRILLALAAVVAVLAPANPAWAHARLLTSDPAKDATLGKAPAAVTLTFSEHLDPGFTTIALSDATRRRLPLSVPAVDATKATASVAQPIGNGTYMLAYRVVSQDGHTVQGSYAFTVADPGLPAAAAAMTPPVAANSPAAPGGVPTGVLVGLAALGVVLAVIAAWFSLSGKRRGVSRART